MRGEKEHTITTEMLDIIRGLMTEDKNAGDDSVAITNDPKFGQNVLKMQQDAFSNAVDAGATFPGDTPLVYIPPKKDGDGKRNGIGDLVFSGVIPNLNNLKFQFRKDVSDGGPFIWSQGMTLNKETLKILNKLYGYYMNWKDEWQKEGSTLENLNNSI